MIFTTYWFLLFSAIFFPCYWLLRSGQTRLALLLAFCTVFHTHFAGPAGMLPILILSITTYLAGLWRNRHALYVGISLPILSLLFYKYIHFVATGIIGAASPTLGMAIDESATSMMPEVPPLAISFFAFEFVHYLYDVLKGNPSIRNPAHFWAFTFFFPSLVAGPVKRYQPFLESLKIGLTDTRIEDIKIGFIRITTGIIKKVILADNLTSAISYWHPSYETMPIYCRWLFVAAIGLRILMDFSGYSDMAIGLARLMGIPIPENFNWPYVSTSIQEFWQRWHISLSSWIRDYIYIPMGGSRCGPIRKATNGLIALSICGLWHGPSWNFILWGIYHGIGLAICSNYSTIFGKPGKAIFALNQRIVIIPWLSTQLFVFIGWILFFYPVENALHMTTLLFFNPTSPE